LWGPDKGRLARSIQKATIKGNKSCPATFGYFSGNSHRDQKSVIFSRCDTKKKGLMLVRFCLTWNCDASENDSCRLDFDGTYTSRFVSDPMNNKGDSGLDTSGA
jgi:hypothetical protein